MVEGEEAGEDFLGGEVGGPVVGGENGLVEGAVGVGEPGGALASRAYSMHLGRFVVGGCLDSEGKHWTATGCTIVQAGH